jgi:hypothetical protein
LVFLSGENTKKIRGFLPIGERGGERERKEKEERRGRRVGSGEVEKALKTNFKNQGKPGTVIHTCNPSYSTG